jgi:hypothetical protein
MLRRILETGLFSFEVNCKYVLYVRETSASKRNSGPDGEAEVRRCVAATGGVSMKTPYDREMERQQNVYESLRNSGFNDRAEACRTDGSKC